MKDGGESKRQVEHSRINFLRFSLRDTVPKKTNFFVRRKPFFSISLADDLG